MQTVTSRFNVSKSSRSGSLATTDAAQYLQRVQQVEITSRWHERREQRKAAFASWLAKYHPEAQKS